MRTDRRLLVSFASFVVALFSTIAFGEDLAVDCQFPGGNIIVEKIVGNRVELHQDPRDTAGFWFYWNFRVRGAAGRTLTFHFTQGDVIGTRGRAVSTDGGANWTWLGLDTVEKNKNNTFAYTFPADAREVRFCFAVPYQESNLRALLDRFAGNPCLKAEPHTKSRKGRTVERLRLGKLDGTPDHRVLLTCRHHSCEMMASWVLEGLLEKVLADTPDGRWLREHVEFLAIPFMDKDGVEEGDQERTANRTTTTATTWARASIPRWRPCGSSCPRGLKAGYISPSTCTALGSAAATINREAMSGSCSWRGRRRNWRPT